eukprot:CFRG8356T1
MALIRAFVSSHVTVNPEVYHQWLTGASRADIVDNQMKLHKATPWPPPYLLNDLLLTEVKDEIRNYTILLHYLKHPQYLPSQRVLQMAPETVRLLLEGYYGFDETFMRHLLGKKLTMRRLRHKLESISRKTKITMHSCRRQYDNLKRIYKVVEDRPGSLRQRIETNFLLSSELAEKYARILFLAMKRFHLSKRRLAYLSFDRLMACSGAIMQEWCSTSISNDDDGYEVDFDPDFLYTIREVKAHVNSERGILDRWRGLVIQDIDNKGMSADSDSGTKISGSVSKMFKPIMRYILQIGGYLARGSECRKVFLEIADRIVDPIQRQTKWTREDVSVVFTSAAEQYREVVSDIGDEAKQTEYVVAVQKLMLVISTCVKEMMVDSKECDVQTGSTVPITVRAKSPNDESARLTVVWHRSHHIGT